MKYTYLCIQKTQYYTQVYYHPNIMASRMAVINQVFVQYHRFFIQILYERIPFNHYQITITTSIVFNIT